MPTITTLGVPGMTCAHCVSSVTEELEGVDGESTYHRVSSVDDSNVGIRLSTQGRLQVLDVGSFLEPVR